MPESQILVQPNSDGSHMGSDLSVVNAARRSFGDRSEYIEDSSGWRLPDKDKRLIQYLARGMTQHDYEVLAIDVEQLGYRVYEENQWGEHQEEAKLEDQLKSLLWKFRDTPEHDTPFNHMFMSFEVKAPVFVARQLVKHEYLVWSEYSRRYKTDDVEFYIPDTWRGKAENKKQGSAGVVDLGKLEDPWLGVTTENYLYLLTKGVAPEQARMVLPQSLMTSWTWSGSFGAFAKMLRLRLAEDSQYETRLVAQQIAGYAKEWFPLSYKALVERDFS